jgi:uncharacterized protein YggE
MSRLLVLFVAAVSTAMAQLESHSVTVSVSRVLYAAPDQASISFAVTTEVTSTLDDVIASLNARGLPALTLNSVSSDTKLTWIFGFTVPLANVGQTLTLLSKLGYDASVNGITLSDVAMSKLTCNYFDLIADAQAQGRTLTDAAGMRLGSVLALADRPYEVTLTGDLRSSSPSFISIAAFVSTPIFRTIPALTCSVTVKFQMLPN